MAEEKYINKYNIVYSQLHIYTREEIGVKLEKESWWELLHNYWKQEMQSQLKESKMKPDGTTLSEKLEICIQDN